MKSKSIKPDLGIHVRSVAATNNLVADGLYYGYYDRAEQVRWKMSDIAWDQIDKSAVSEYWLTTITQIARSELTTFDGTRQFMERFGDNADFSQWVALWLYEETKHPHVLMLWLSRLGVACDSQFLIEGRESPKFAASWLGTLTLNVIAELLAAHAYLTLSKYAPEPVLADITRKIAGDEARHAAHFFGYGKRLLARCEFAIPS